MDVVLIFLFILLIAVLLNVRNSIMDRFDRLEREILRLREGEKRPAPPAYQRPASPDPLSQLAKEQPTPPAQPTSQRPAASPSEPAAHAAALPPGAARRPKPMPQPEAQPGFFEQHPDLEKFIGENLVSKIGIAVLVLAIGFFVKYAIDNDWIGPVGRVGVGVLCGGILIGIAHWLRKQYKAFSSVLVGGGLAVLYCTIALAYHQYQLLGQTAAFIVMLVITAFSVLLALLYDRQELAIIALVGGFVTPFLVSNGRDNYAILFTYLLILNAGLLVIAYNKAWRLLNILAFGFTALLYASWLLSLPYDAPDATYRGGWEFATIFYLLFFVINTGYTIRSSKPFIASDFIILLVNTCLYFAAGLYLIEQLGLDRYKGLFSAGMGVVNLGATWFLFRKTTVDKNILYLLVGITLSFVSLTAPLQLHGHYITLFWASETVLLYWLFLKSQIKLIQLSSGIVWMAMLISLFIDWVNIYAPGSIYAMQGAQLRQDVLPIVFNKGFITGIYVAICSGALFYLRRETAWARASMIAAVAVLYIAGALEINHQIGHRLPVIDLTLLYFTGYTYGFVLLFARFTKSRAMQFFRLAAAGLLTAGVLFYLFSLPEIFDLQEMMLETGHYRSHFAVHWTGAFLVILILGQLFAGQRAGRTNVKPAVFTWLICIITVTLLSAEGQLLVNNLWYSKAYDLHDLSRIYNKTGLPILWGLCSFAFMWLGMRHKFKPLRIVSLVLFSLTLVKLFLFDIRNIPVAGKIAAFFCLGVLLLVVSFMYQRLKKIIIEDEEKKTL
jgi:uncharacterized membrane protein